MEIPLFPLHTVLSPGIALPLHIFEERYRVMVRRCLDDEVPFGVVLIREGREVEGRTEGGSRELSIAPMGTFAEIREASRYDDGRWDILTVGAGRFVVNEVVAGREPYLVGIVDPIEDAVGDPAAAEELAGRVTRRFVEYLRLLQPREGEEVEPIDVQVEVEVEEPDDADDAARATDDEDADNEDADDEDADDEDADDEDADDEDADDEDADRGPEALAAALHIPDDPVALSFLLAGIVQVEVERKQALLEAPTAEDRLRALDVLLSREIALLGMRLAPFTPDRRSMAARDN
jgi:Lon protease-like protein